MVQTLQTQAQLTKAFGRANAFGIRTGALDNFVDDANSSGQFGGTVGSGSSGSGNLGRYENSLELSEAEFDRCLSRLGASHPPLRKRFFKVRTQTHVSLLNSFVPRF